MCRNSGLLVCVVVVFCVGGGSVMGQTIMQCDTGGCGPLQSGWVSLGACGTFPNVAGSGIDVTLSTGNPGACECRNPGGSGTLSDVEADLLFANDEESSPGGDFIITMSNLTPGMTYRLLSYHNRSDEGDTTIAGVTITGGTPISVPAGIVQNHAIMDDPAECVFTAGAGDVSIRYLAPVGGCAGCQAFLNGFVLEYVGPTLSFSTDTSGGIESISPAIIEVVLTNAVGGATYTVQYAATGGTATPGDDYNLTPDTLVFNPGDTTKTISIEIITDDILEEDETIILELSYATGPDVMLGMAEHTYIISDLAPKVLFDSATSSGLESSSPAMIKVKLSHSSDDTVTVNYGVTGGTATNGTDYSVVGNMLTFVPGDVTEYITVNIVDDTTTESQETIELALSGPANATIGTPGQHTYSILDNEQGVYFDGLIWYYSDTPNPLYVTPENHLVWLPEKDEQFITRLPEQSLSVGNKVEISYWWMTDGDHDCPDCRACPGCFDDDITCLAGTSDMRAGLFEADGDYITGDGFDVYGNSVFVGYKGYGWRFGPNMEAEPTYWRDCTDEAHKTGQFQKKSVDLSNLLSTNDGLVGVLPGFELTPGEWSLWTISLERTDTDTIVSSITLNDRTYTWTDSSGDDFPNKIDVFAITMRNGRPFSILSLQPVPPPPPPCKNLAGDPIIDWDDLAELADYWIKRCGWDTWCEGHDINEDLKVNILDFACLAYWWQQPCPPQ
jgi:hypothetical protein